MMAQAKDWKSLAQLSLKATLGTGNQFFADYNKINKERESLASIKCKY